MIVLAVGLFLSPVAAMPSVLVDRIVASVEDRVVTRSMIDNKMKLGAASSRVALRDALVNDLIVMTECERLSIVVESEEIDRALQEVATRNAITQDQLVAAVEAKGMTVAMYRDELRKQMLTMRWVMQQGDQRVEHQTPEQLSAWIDGQLHRLIDEARTRQIVDIRDGEP